MKAKRIRDIRDELIRDLALDKSATTEMVCHRLCQVMSDRLGRPIELCFADLGDGVTGLSAIRSEDGLYLIIVTTARSWMHRLFILLHEIAHLLCGHEPASLTTDEVGRLFYPDLSARMFQIIATRTTLLRAEEREADRVAGELARALIRWASHQEVPLFQPEVEDDATRRTWYSLGYAPTRDRDG